MLVCQIAQAPLSATKFFTACSINAQLPVPSGFMHVPLLPEQTLERAADGDSTRQQPSLALHDMVRGVREALTAACVSLSRSSAKPT
jgi:pyrrolidone-carboxylate peptidase